MAEKKKHLEKIINQLKIHVAYVDKDMKYQFINQAYEDSFKIKKEDIIGKNVEDIIGSQKYADVVGNLEKVFNGETVNYKGFIVYPNGNECFTDETLIPDVVDGEVVGYYGIIQDITNLVQHLNEKEESELKFQSIYDGSLDAIGVSVNGIHYHVNKAYLDLFGYDTVDELKDVPITKLIAEREHERILNYVRQRNLGDDNNLPSQYETIGVKKDGTEFPFEIKSTRYTFKGVNYTIVNIRDQKEKRNLLYQLKQKNRILNMINEVNQAIIFQSEEQILLENICSILCEMGSYRFAWIGYKESDSFKTVRPVSWYGEENEYLKSIRISWGENDFGNGPTGICIRKKQSVLRNAEEVDYRFWEKHAEKSCFNSSIALPIIVDNEAIGALNIYSADRTVFTHMEVEFLDQLAVNVGIGISSLRNSQLRTKLINDLSEATKKAQESDKLKSAFLANLSHEIRTPMNSILGFSDLLSSPNTSDEKREKFIELIQTSGKQLLKIISDVLDISKIEAGQLEVNNEEFELVSMISDLCEIYRSDYQVVAKKLEIIQLRNEQQPGPFLLFSDASKIEQIIDNLVTNAIKFTPQGQIQIGFKLSGKSEITIFVKDTGIGLRRDEYSIIFDRFRQAENNLYGEHTGTGLGLAIVKGLVELLGGKIWLESEVGKGSTFYFSIPFQQVILTKSGRTITGKSPVFNENMKNKTILVAEDHLTNFILIKEILSDINVEIIHAINGERAVEIFQTNTDIDLIIMDLKMPKVDGFQACSMIKKINPNIPIIAHTAFAMKHEKQKVMEHGFDGYISKPLRSAELVEIIGNLIKV